jgi:hypothetical protein
LLGSSEDEKRDERAGNQDWQSEEKQGRENLGIAPGEEQHDAQEKRGHQS